MFLMSDRGGNFKYSSWLLDKYVNKVKPIRKLKIEKILNELNVVFGKSKIKFPKELRIKTSEIVLRLMNRKKISAFLSFSVGKTIGIDILICPT